jgi:hypothetical protein
MEKSVFITAVVEGKHVSSVKHKKIMFYTLRFWSDEQKMRHCYKLCFQRPFENNSEVAPPHSKNCNDEESIDRDNFNHLEEQQATNV